MRSRQRTITVIATTLALLAAAGWWWLHGPHAPVGLGEATVAPSQAAATTSTAVRPSARAAAESSHAAPPSRSLPPDNAPLADVFDELKARADAGDARAACRLAVDLLDCGAIGTTAAQQFDRLRAREAASDGKGDLAEANRYAQMQEQLLAARQRCARIDPDQIALAGDYLRSAATAGVPEAMLRYASGQGFGSDSSLSALRHPGFDAWRRDALAMMQASLRDGRPGAVAMLSEAYRNDDTLLFSGLVTNDTVQARTYLVLYQRLLGRNVPPDTPQISPGVLAQMKAAGIDTRTMNPTPAQIRQSDAEADRLYRSYFGGQPLADKRAMGRWLNLGARASSADRAADPPRCS